jgi:hypothetical protein
MDSDVVIKHKYIITKKQNIQTSINMPINTNTIIKNIIKDIIEKKILNILKTINIKYPEKFKKQYINIEYNIIKNNINIIHTLGKKTSKIKHTIHKHKIIEQPFRCSARIWGHIYDKITLKKIISLDNIFKVIYLTKLKLNEFNTKYIIGTQCVRHKHLNSIFCYQHIQHLTHGNYYEAPDSELCLHYIKDGKYI